MRGDVLRVELRRATHQPHRVVVPARRADHEALTVEDPRLERQRGEMVVGLVLQPCIEILDARGHGGLGPGSRVVGVRARVGVGGDANRRDGVGHRLRARHRGAGGDEGPNRDGRRDQQRGGDASARGAHRGARTRRGHRLIGDSLHATLPSLDSVRGPT